LVRRAANCYIQAKLNMDQQLLPPRPSKCKTNIDDESAFHGGLPSPISMVKSFNDMLLDPKQAERVAHLQKYSRGWDNGFIEGVHCALATIKQMYLEDVRKFGSSHTRVLSDIRNKDSLIAIQDTLDNMLSKAYRVQNVNDYMIEHGSSLQPFAEQVLGRPSGNPMADVVVISMINILAFMQFRMMGIRVDGWESGHQHFKHMSNMVLGKNVAIVSDGSLAPCAGIPCGERFDVDGKNDIIDPDWIMNRGFMQVARIWFAWHPTVKSWNDAKRAEIEKTIMTEFIDLLCAVRTEVRIRLDAAMAAQNKIVSLASTSTITLATWLMHNAPVAANIVFAQNASDPSMF